MKVVIDAGDRRVEIECDATTKVTVAQLVRHARNVWDATATAASPPTAAGVGFVSERKPVQMSPMNLGGYGRESIGDIRAEATR